MNHSRAFAALAFIAVVSAALVDSAGAAPPRPFRVVGKKLSASAQPALDRLNSIASRPFIAIPSPVSSGALSISGGAVDVRDGDATNTARKFFRDHGAVFALDAGVDLVPLTLGVPTDRRITFELTIAGVPIDGLRARAVFDESGRLVSASLAAPKSFETLGGFGLGEEQAKAAGRAAMRVTRVGLGHVKLVEFADAVARKVWVRTDAGLVPAWKTNHWSVRPGEAWTVIVDARDGTVLDTRDDIARGTGNFPMDFDTGTSQLTTASFTTKNGKARVFKSQSAAIAGTTSKRKLVDLAAPPPAGNPLGFVQGNVAGAHLHVLSDTLPDAFASNLKFPTANPFNDEEGVFDQTNTYFQIEEFYRHLRSITGGQLASNFSLPVVVNFDPGDFIVNAFFSPTPFGAPGNPYMLGFLLFHDLNGYLSDENVLCGPEFDLSRDPVAACHEYTHAWLFYEFLDFFGFVQCPARAINEAMADVFSTAFHKDVLVGRYLGSTPAGQLAFPSGALRVLNGDAHYPETTLEALVSVEVSPGNFVDLPEEHLNSVMFSSMTRDVAREIGNRKVEQHVFDALPNMPHTELDVGFDNQDIFSDPFIATDVFNANVCNALLLLDQPLSHYLAFLGTMTGRGIFGSVDPSNGDLFNNFFVLNNLELFPNRKMTLPSVFPRSTCGQIYYFQAKQGRTLKVTVKAENGESLEPDFAVVVLNGGDPGLITPKNNKTFRNNGHTVTQKFTLGLPLDANSDETDPFYVLL